MFQNSDPSDPVFQALFTLHSTIFTEKLLKSQMIITHLWAMAQKKKNYENPCSPTLSLSLSGAEWPLGKIIKLCTCTRTKTALFGTCRSWYKRIQVAPVGWTNNRQTLFGKFYSSGSLPFWNHRVVGWPCLVGSKACKRITNPRNLEAHLVDAKANGDSRIKNLVSRGDPHHFQQWED